MYAKLGRPRRHLENARRTSFSASVFALCRVGVRVCTAFYGDAVGRIRTARGEGLVAWIYAVANIYTVYMYMYTYLPTAWSRSFIAFPYSVAVDDDHSSAVGSVYGDELGAVLRGRRGAL